MDLDNKSFSLMIEKAQTDSNFRAKLVSDPLETLANHFGREFNLGGKNIVVRDQTDESTVYINIPENSSDFELSDKQLEAVAGGCWNPVKQLFHKIHEFVDWANGPGVGCT